MIAPVRRLPLALLIVALAVSVAPATAGAARYTGPTSQGRSISITTTGSQVTAMQWRWRVRCSVMARTLYLTGDFSLSRPGSMPIPIRAGRFRMIWTIPFTLARPALRTSVRSLVGGSVRGSTASGYLYQTLLAYRSDGTLLDACQTGRVSWTARLPATAARR